MVLTKIGSWLLTMPTANIVRRHFSGTVNTSQWIISKAVSQQVWRALKLCGLRLAPSCCHLTTHLGKAASWTPVDAIQVTCAYCWWHEESHNAIWLPRQLNMISTTSSHNQQAITLYCGLDNRESLQHIGVTALWTRNIQQFYTSKQVKIPPLKQGGSHCHEVLPLAYSGENSILKMLLLPCCTFFSMAHCKQHFSIFDFK